VSYYENSSKGVLLPKDFTHQSPYGSVVTALTNQLTLFCRSYREPIRGQCHYRFRTV